MNRLVSTAIALGAAGTLAACDQAPKTPAAKSTSDYEIVKNGIVKEENKHNYESLGDTTFIRTQAFKVRRTTKGAEKDSRILFLKYVVKVGNKDINDGVIPVVIDKGEGELLCANSYDVKIANYDTTPDPSCTYTSLGDASLTPANVAFK